MFQCCSKFRNYHVKIDPDQPMILTPNSSAKLDNSYHNNDNYIFLVLIFDSHQVKWDIIDKSKISNWNILCQYLITKYQLFQPYTHYTFLINNSIYNPWLRTNLSYLVSCGGIQIKIDSRSEV